MDILNNPSRDTWDALTERNIPNDAAIKESVREIVATVKAQGDEALRTYARKFDGAEITEIEISEAERQAATAKVAENVKRAIATAAKNIAAFHAAQRPAPVEVETAKGVCCYQRAVPIQRVGLYIPGGQAPLFSTVLMLGLPARIAGCKEVVLCTPQGHDGEVALKSSTQRTFAASHTSTALEGRKPSRQWPTARRASAALTRFSDLATASSRRPNKS